MEKQTTSRLIGFDQRPVKPRRKHNGKSNYDLTSEAKRENTSTFSLLVRELIKCQNADVFFFFSDGFLRASEKSLTCSISDKGTYFSNQFQHKAFRRNMKAQPNSKTGSQRVPFFFSVFLKSMSGDSFALIS